MAQNRLFGTDGVRGVANIDLTASLAMNLGMAAGHFVRVQAEQSGWHPTPNPPAEGVTGQRPFVIIGRDTRLSGDMLETALAAGLAAMGIDVVNVGVVPTPAVAQIVLARGAAAGAVISASHNPFEDNGIKFFGANGKKLPDATEEEIERYIERLADIPRPTGGDIGRIVETHVPVADYVLRVMNTVERKGGKALDGLRLVMDCANGAAYEIAPRIFRDLGADVTVMDADPDGVNINVDCGSTKPAAMAAKVREIGAHAGLAFDGDADRVMMSDEHGNIVDGDKMMALIAIHLQEQNRLTGETVVATIMSNVGLEQALNARGIRLHRTDVGDRYVGAAMDSLGAALGGEQSGHILLPYLSPTGDGMITALQVLEVVHDAGKPLSELAAVVQPGPQLLRNVRVRTKQGWKEDPEIQAAIAEGVKRLGKPEWLSVRPSGTEQLIRVMAQGIDQDTVTSVVIDICGVIERKLA
jgi:phosphoglucosamine mutase